MNVPSSLTNRIFLGSALLAVVSMAVATYRMTVAVSTQAEADLRAKLEESATLVSEFARAQFADFVVKGTLIADLPVLRNAASTEHPPTVQPIAEDYQRRIGADVFVVVGRSDAVLASAGRVRPAADQVRALLEAGRAEPDGATFWPLAGGVVHAAAVPMESGPSPAGTLIVGFSLDQDAAERLKAVTRSDVAFVSGGRVIATTRPGLPDTLIAGLGPSSGVFLWRLPDDEVIGRVEPLGAGTDRPEPLAVVLRSRTEQLAFLGRLRWQIAITGLAAVAVATLLGYGVARTVTRPIRAVTATMREMAATGDLTRSVPAGGRWDDEDARLLSSTFGQLTGALGRFQREAAQRERLSSLGRLSTVVAHEVRNPLMIIKAAVRTLRRHTSPDVSAAAENIDEEVRRLDGVVTGVLDFAKPIRFELAPVDLVEVCRDACEAARISAPGLDLRQDLPARSLVLSTDAERLRAVLVNLLANALDAIRTGDGAADAASRRTPAILLRLHQPQPGLIRIEVVDRGPGIAAEDLPKLFEPFFTTRRTGSGLGLAIARNIIEGLGGTITIASRPGAGTTVRVDLPHATERKDATL
jgi:signal transduction histidine kinase